MLVILDMYLEDLSSVRVAKEIMSINPEQRMILASTSPLNDIKNLVKDVTISISRSQRE